MTPEEKVRQEYICRLVKHYGYSLDQMHQEVTVAEGNKRGTGRASADIVVWRNKGEVYKRAPVIAVECKADNINIVEGDYFQGSHYARYMKTPLQPSSLEMLPQVSKLVVLASKLSRSFNCPSCPKCP